MNYQDEAPSKGFIPRSVHGVLDYLGSAVMIAAPWLFGYSHIDNAAALFLPIFFGALTAVMSLFTKYEASPFKVFPFQLHLILDMIAGFVLLVSPFLWGFYQSVFLPQVIIGLYLMGSAIFTQGSPLMGKMEVLDSRGL